MPRIRTIKPEFPQSESVGRLSRDARLLFIQLWTLADDAGRTRAAPRMLASLLYPYDDDAPELMDGWLQELESNDHICIYEVDGSRYLEITHWSKHQKIDRPTGSRLPGPTGVISDRVIERDIESCLFQQIEQTHRFLGHDVIEVRRQVRIKESYLDLVVKCREITFVVEIKRTYLSEVALKQVLKYSNLAKAAPVLIGAGMSAHFSLSACAENHVAVITYDELFTAILIQGTDHVTTCDLTLNNVIQRDALDLGPRTMDHGPGTDAVANAPRLPEAALFDRGKEVLGRNSGGMIKKLLTAKQGNVALARAAIEQASTKSDPREYIGRIINPQSDLLDQDYYSG